MKSYFYINVDVNEKGVPKVESIHTKYKSPYWEQIYQIGDGYYPAIETTDLDIKAKDSLTDFISQSLIPGISLLISRRGFEKMKPFVDQSDVHVYSSRIFHKGIDYNYKMIFLNIDLIDLIDYSRTKFSFYNILEGNRTIMQFESRNDYLYWRLNRGVLGFDNIFETCHLLPEKVVQTKGHFLNFGSSILISEDVKHLLTYYEFTGFELGYEIQISEI